MKQENNWQYLKPLYNLCNVLAITPPHQFGNSATAVSARFKIYTVIHIVGNVVLYIHSSYGRETFVYPVLESTVALTDKLANLILALFNVATRVILIFYNDKITKAFFSQGYQLSKQETLTSYCKRSFIAQFAAFNLYMFVLLMFDGYFWINSIGLTIFQFYFGRSLMYYSLVTTMFLISHSVLPLKHLFASLGVGLETIVKNLVCDSDARREYFVAEFKMSKNLRRLKYHHADLRIVRKHYNTICTLVDDFNTMYGFIILMVILVVVAYVLNLTDLLLVYGVTKVKDIDGVQFGTDLTVVCGLWIVTLLGFAIFLAYGCVGAVSESEKISKICFFWLNEIPTIPVSNEEKVLKEELVLMVQQSTSRCPKFSAAGFFPVDFTLLGFIFGSVTSYIIISIQFIH
ncbi:unnamed protein product [Tenebrio molitor]|nr:unnamed protein product [Tenebrio molitor]